MSENLVEISGNEKLTMTLQIVNVTLLFKFWLFPWKQEKIWIKIGMTCRTPIMKLGNYNLKPKEVVAEVTMIYH